MNFKGLIIVLSLFAITMNAQNIYQQKMQRINGAQHSSVPLQDLTPYQGKPLLASFFMPDCRWCQKQHKVLSQLQNRCPNLQTIMLGVQGSKQRLRQALKRGKNTFPAFIANKEIVQAIGTKSPVPMMIFISESGDVLFKTVGYANLASMSALLKEHEVCS